MKWYCTKNYGPHHGVRTCHAHMDYESWWFGKLVARISLIALKEIQYG